MRNKQLQSFLDDHNIKYNLIKHALTYTAPETAAAAHIPGKELAKTVIVKIKGRLAMIVEPSHLKLNLASLKKELGTDDIQLANEFEFQDRFKGCEIGAMPPFGELWGVDVLLDSRLAEEQNIVFSAGTHSELIKMSFKDFEKLVKPKYLRVH